MIPHLVVIVNIMIWLFRLEDIQTVLMTTYEVKVWIHFTWQVTPKLLVQQSGRGGVMQCQGQPTLLIGNPTKEIT